MPMHILRPWPLVLMSLLLLGMTASKASSQHTSRTMPGEGGFIIPYETYQLPNGLTVILSPDTVIPLVAVQLTYRVGSADEARGRTGFAHLFEHQLLGGSAHVTAGDISRIMTDAGGARNGNLDFDRTRYWWVLGSSFLESALWMLSDQMGFSLPVLTEQKLANQREIVKNERRQRVEDQPLGLMDETVLAALYPSDHPYAHPMIGSMVDLDAATLADIRDFYGRYYRPNNALLAIVGDFDPIEIRGMIAKYFGTIPSGSPVARPQPAEVALDSAIYVVMEDRVQVPWLMLTWPTPGKYAAGSAEINVLSRVLGLGPYSRLYRRLVLEEQIAQSVAAYPDEWAFGGRFNVRIQPVAGVSLDRLENAVLDEIERVRREPLTQDEITQAATNIEASTVRALEARLNRADALTDFVTFSHGTERFNQYVERHRGVTPEGAQAAAQLFLGEGHVVFSGVPLGRLDLQATP